MTNTTSRVEAIRQHIQASYGTLLLLVDGPLTALASEKLYQAPAQGEWSIMQNLAHVVEIMPYWGNEIARAVREPGQKFGRTAEDADRLRALDEHGTDALTEAQAALPNSYAQLDRVLATLKDSDLELTAIHKKYGERTLDWFIDEFVTTHIAGHVEQIQSCMAAV
jgi:DinB superfamily